MTMSCIFTDSSDLICNREPISSGLPLLDYTDSKLILDFLSGRQGVGWPILCLEKGGLT